VFPGAVRRALTPRNLVIAVCWFLVGAFPLVRHNVRRNFETWRANVGYTTEGMEGKFYVMRSSLDGSGLFGFVASDEPGPRPAEPHSPLERASVGLSRLAGEPRRGPLPFILAGRSCCCRSCGGRGREARFCSASFVRR